MKHYLISRSFLVLVIFTLACSGSKNSSTITPPKGTVGIVDGEFISYSELKDNFESGSLNQEYSVDDLIEFLPVYLDYKGKIKDAKKAGYYEDERIKNEYELYAKQAAYAFWMEKEIRPTKFNEFKERYDYELKSKHVLIALQPLAPPADTLEAYNRIMEARNEFLNGTSLEELDARYSTSRNGRSMGGDLPWFSVGTTVPEFESALYSLEVGELSMPVRTQFGYHLIYLEERRERNPSRQISHIFVRRNSDQTKIDEAFKNLSNGETWNEVVTRYSEDAPSIQNAGYIGWVNYGSRYSNIFIDSVMALDPAQEFSTPIETNYGYHIFRVDSVRTFNTEDERDAHIMNLLEESDSFRENNSYVIEYLQGKYPTSTTSENLVAYEAFIQATDSSVFSDISLNDSLSTKSLYRFNDIEFNVSEFHDYLVFNHGSKTRLQFTSRWYESFKEASVDENLTKITLMEYPEFEEQVKSYQDGLVVYQVNEDSVWSTATIDTSALLQRYNENLENYTFPERYHYYMITSSRDTSLDRAIEFIESGNSPDSLFAKGFRVGVSSDSTGTFQGEPFSQLVEMEQGTISERFEYGGRKGHFLLIDVLPSRTMTFDESFNRLASEYQPEREESWLTRIRNEFNIQSFPEVVRAFYNLEETGQ